MGERERGRGARVLLDGGARGMGRRQRVGIGPGLAGPVLGEE